MAEVPVTATKAKAAAAGAVVGFPSAEVIYGWIEQFFNKGVDCSVATNCWPPFVDSVAVILIGAAIAGIVTFFAPGNVPK